MAPVYTWVISTERKFNRSFNFAFSICAIVSFYFSLSVMIVVWLKAKGKTNIFHCLSLYLTNYFVRYYSNYPEYVSFKQGLSPALRIDAKSMFFFTKLRPSFHMWKPVKELIPLLADRIGNSHLKKKRGPDSYRVTLVTCLFQCYQGAIYNSSRDLGLSVITWARGNEPTFPMFYLLYFNGDSIVFRRNMQTRNIKYHNQLVSGFRHKPASSVSSGISQHTCDFVSPGLRIFKLWAK